MFKSVSSRFNPTLLEEEILNFWKLRRTFFKCAQKNQGSAEFVLYEYPPCANKRPDLDHALGRSFKDAILRYRLMRGYHVTRRGGWHTHGLQIEMGIENELGFTSKSQIETYGIDRFNSLCRKSTFQYLQEWEHFNDRLGYWLDMQDAYVTHTNEYIESVWWVVKTLWDRGLLYPGFKVVPYCPRCGVSFSDQEAAVIQREADAPSIYVRMPLTDEPGVSFLIQTDTPWTLLGNAVVAVDPDIDYVTIRRGLPEGGSEQLILEHSALKHVFGEQSVSIVNTFKGRKLKGKRYRPLFTFLQPDKPAYYVILQVSGEHKEGTGLTPIIPAFEADDLQAAIENDLPILNPIANDGTFVPEIRPWSGMFIQDADPIIIQDLDSRGLLFSTEAIRRKVSFCGYCGRSILNCGRNNWYIAISKRRPSLVEFGRQVTWNQSQIMCDIDFKKTNDWIVSRERFWGTPLPIWQCPECHHQLVIGSIAELSRLAGQDLNSLDLHRPRIDEIQLPCPECKGTMNRVPEVVADWVDTAALPTAQWHFPSENRSLFREQFPADLVCEPETLTPGWLVPMHAINALLFESITYKKAISLRPVHRAEEKNPSNASAEYADLWNIFNSLGADGLRWHFYTSPIFENERPFFPNLVKETTENVAQDLWDVYAFFVAHANLDHWQPVIDPEGFSPTGKTAALDNWLISELHSLAWDVTHALENDNLTSAAQSISVFISDLSNWYLHCSRHRLLRKEVDTDKANAYDTLYSTLVTLSILLAPLMPFLSEAIYQNLVRSFDLDAPESVHLCSWPGYNEDKIDDGLKRDMRLVRQLAELGQHARIQAGIKTRQPLAEAVLVVNTDDEVAAINRYADLIADQLNVKRIRSIITTELATNAEAQPSITVASDNDYRVTLETQLDAGLIREGMAREFAFRMQELREQTNFEVAVPVRITLTATPELWKAIQAHEQYILEETQAEKILRNQPSPEAIQTEAWFDGQWMKASISPCQEPSGESDLAEEQI